MLGMTGQASPWSPPLIEDLPTILTIKGCRGNEISLADCQLEDKQEEYCTTFLIRGVSCGNPNVFVKKIGSDMQVPNKQLFHTTVKPSQTNIPTSEKFQVQVARKTQRFSGFAANRQSPLANGMVTEDKDKASDHQAISQSPPIKVSSTEVQDMTALHTATLHSPPINVTSTEEQNPWIEQTLERSVYIYAVTLNRSCHARNDSQHHILPVVIAYDSDSGRSIQCTITEDTERQQIAKCDVDFKTNVIRIRSSDKNATLKFCSDPDVSAFDNFSNIRGVLYELWYRYDRNLGMLKYNDVYDGIPNISSVSPSFTIPGFSGQSNYSMREKGYVMVDNSGLYFLSASCGGECEIWTKRVLEQKLDDREVKDNNYYKIKIYSPTYPIKYKLSTSQYRYQYFSKCHLYYMEVYMRQRTKQDYLTVVTRLPGKNRIQLIPPEYLYWMRPGYRILEFQLINQLSTKIALGSEITFEAVYKFCCKGILCPSCPLVLKLEAFGQTIMVNRSLEMTCEEHRFRHNMKVILQPGNYSINITNDFQDDNTKKGERRRRTIVESIHVSDSTRLHCSFRDRKCLGWSVKTRDGTCQWSLQKREEKETNIMHRGDFIALTTPGLSFLESPFMPWNSYHKHISLCAEFSYLLPSNTTSRLEVYRKTNSSKDLLWSVTGHHGNKWQRANIPLKSDESFQMTLIGESKTNGSISTAIRDFQVTSRSCRHRPEFAEPGLGCEVTEFQCANGQCINKHQRCNGIHGDCLDGSDEEGCVCKTGYFTCANQKCIYHDRLCDGETDCGDVQDERHCDKKCPEHQCLDGTCSSCGQRTHCEEERHNLSCDALVTKQTANFQSCQIPRGICGFDNVLCGFQNDTNGTLYWIFFKPVDYRFRIHNFPKHDHSSLTDRESYIILKSNEQTKSGQGRILKHWSATPNNVCLQFWYFIPDKSKVLLEIFIEEGNAANSLWKTSKSTADDWAFGQVQIPGNASGKIIITGRVRKSFGFLALDDLGFVENGCASVYLQRDLSSPPAHLSLNGGSGRLYDKRVIFRDGGGILTFQLVQRKAERWRCFRSVWHAFHRTKSSFGRNVLAMEFQAGNRSSIEAWSSWTENPVTGKLIQLPIPEKQERLQIRVEGEISGGVIKFDFSKEHCQKIPAHQECQEYKTLSYSDRREDSIADNEIFQGCDDHLSSTAWYRVVGSAGNQLARSCIKRNSSCSSKYMGWVNGSLPSVEDGVVERQLCFASEVKCCVKETIVKIRNCKEYFVYLFPKKVTNCPSKYCTVYRQKINNSNIQNEWKGWAKGRDKKVQWEVLSENSYKKVANSIMASKKAQGCGNFTNESDIGVLVGPKNHSINVQISQTLKRFTMCLWTTIRTLSPIRISTPLKIKVDYVEVENGAEVTNVAFLEFGATRNRNMKWSHVCVTWMSDFGVWQTYIDGAIIHHGNGVLDKEELYSGNRIMVTFDSQDQKTEIKYSRLNIWRKLLSEQEILYMSYECETENGNLLGWDDYLKNLKMLPRDSHDFRIMESTCRGKEESVQSVIKPSLLETSSAATIESPRYERSSNSSKRCLMFRYKIWGPGARSLKIYQELDDNKNTRRPIWMVRGSEDSRWRDGQVSIVALAAYKIIIEGEISNRPGLMSIGALYSPDGSCGVKPRSAANQACNEILTNRTGYILLPIYPDLFYESDKKINCDWVIKAKKDHVIRLEFKAFELGFSQRCSGDYVEVYDGDVSPSASRIGRYCGMRYPPIIQSQSNTIRILFRSRNRYSGILLKVYYKMIKGLKDDGCIQDCPISCNCRRLEDGGITIISHHQMQSLPNHLPTKTNAILFRGSQIYQVESNAFTKLSYLSLIDLSYNRIFLVEEMSFVDLPSLKTLRLNRNFIKEVKKNMFSSLGQLEAIDLGQNLISSIELDTFSGFPALRALSLRSNRIKELDKLTFQNNTNLTYLYLQENVLKRIPPGIFRRQKNLVVLLLHDNEIERIDKSSFQGLTNLRKLTLRNNSINEQSISKDVFDDLRNLEYLSIDSFIICCYATNSIPNLKCDSPGNEFSSCNDMLKSIYVQICIWIEAFFAILGNLAVIIWWTYLFTRRVKTRRKINRVQSLLFCHLAFADFLMGVYLLIIGTYNEIWKGEYFLHDVEWRAGVKCKIAGTIATLSSEVSVMILVAITADRINTILFHFSSRRISMKVAHILSLFIWAIGLVMSFTPLLVPSFFNDKVSGFSFYGRSSVCLPLQLSIDRPAGWEYSVGIFIGFNGAAFLFILVGYTAIFLKARKSGQNVRKSSRGESSLGRRVFFVILTDFCCWMPIMVLGVLSLIGKFDDPSMYIWVAAFVLPINSAINPMLYTFSSSQTVNIARSVRRKWLRDREGIRAKRKHFPKKRKSEKSSEELTG